MSSERIDRLALEMGYVRGTVDGLHRRMDASETHIWAAIRHVDQKRTNGGTKWRVPYNKISAGLLFLILGTLGFAYPEAFKGAVAKFLEKVLAAALIGG